MGIRVARVDGNRTLIGVDRLLQLVRRLEDDAQIVVAIRAIRLERQAPFDERDRFVAAPLLMREHAGIVQGVRMIRRRFEHPALHLLGLHELVIFLEENCERNRFLERQLARGF